MTNNSKTAIEVSKIRLESLKGNRNFFTILFSIESATLALAVKYLGRLSFEFAISIFFLLSSIILILFGVFALTDSIHSYSKNLEYRYMWKHEVHIEACKGKKKQEKAITEFRRALEADDVGYYFLRLCLLLFMCFLVSLVLNIYELGAIRLVVFFFGVFIVTYLAVYSYKTTHGKHFSEAFFDFFWRDNVFQIKSSEKQPKVISLIKSKASSIIIVLLIISLVGGCVLSYNSGQIFVAKHVRHNVEVVENLSSIKVQSELMQYFPEKLNYTEIFVWESTRINYTQNREIHTDPIEILNYGKGACGEFSILYVAACLANDIPARLVVTGYVITGSVDHSWAEVNPSKDGKTWIHVEPTDCAYNILQGKEISELTSCYDNPSRYYNKGYELILAFEPTQDGEVVIWDRTEFYSGQEE
jgi:hypothetical protein